MADPKSKPMGDLDGIEFDEPESAAKLMAASSDGFDAPSAGDGFDAPPSEAIAPPAPQITRPAKVVTVSDAPRPEKSGMAQFLEAAHQGLIKPAMSAAQTGIDAARGYGQGATFGAGDEGASRLVPEVDDGTGIPRTYAAGSAQKDMQAQMRRDNAEAQKRSPFAYGAGEIAGMVPTSIAVTPTAPGAGLAARTALRAGTTGSQALLSSMGHSDLAPEQQGRDAKSAAASALGTDAALQLFLASAGAGGRAAAPALKRGADYLRGKATGIMPAQARQMLANEGAEAIPDMGAFVEREGLHLNKRGLPASSKAIHENATRLADKTGERIGDLTEWMSETEGVQKPTASVFASARGVVSSLKSAARLPEEQLAAQRAADDLAKIEEAYSGKEMMSVADIHDLKQRLQKRVYESTKAAQMSPAPDLSSSHGAIANQKLDANVRGQMYDLVNDPDLKWGGASKESATEFGDVMQRHGGARTVQKAAEKRAGHQMGYVPLGLTALAGGAAVGGGAYGQDHDAHTAAGATALGVLGTIAANRYGANYGATGLRAMQQAAEQLPAIAGAVSHAPVGALAGAHGERSPNMPQPPIEQKPQPPRSSEPSPGNGDFSGWLSSVMGGQQRAPTPPAVKNVTEAMRDNPAALGPYAQKLQAAERKGPEGMAAEHATLAASDPEYQRIMRDLGEEDEDRDLSPP